MRKTTKIAPLMALMALSSLDANAQEIVYEDSFDDIASTQPVEKLPDGWATEDATEPFKRYRNNYIMSGAAHSGNYVIGTLQTSNRDSWLFTKGVTLKAGVKYTVKYWLRMPGGAAPVFDNNVITCINSLQKKDAVVAKLGETGRTKLADWTEMSYEFTPETDGTYYIAFNMVTPMYQSDYIAIDDLEISYDENTGGGGNPTDPEPELPDGVVCELPYSQSFDNENEDYDGKSFVPNGWLSTGTSPFVTASMDAVSAVDGTYYLIAPESMVKRDDRLYTPFYKMTKGVTYTAKFYLYMPGDIDTGNVGDFAFTVGTEQDSEFHTPLLTKTAYHNTKWTEVSVDYTPDATGYYCFSFVLGGEALSGEVAIDLFSVKAPGMISRPKAAFSFNGHFNLMDSKLVAFEGSKLQMVNQSTDAESYLWTVDGAEPSTSTEENPAFSFPASGDYQVRLTVKNAKGENTAFETVSVTKLGDEAQGLPIGANNPNEDKIWTRSDLPSYETAPDADYVTGVNHYYRCIAERFDLPAGREYNLTSLTFYLCYYSLASGQYNEQAAAPFNLVVYGDKDGLPDMNNVYGRYTTTMQGAFGTMGLSKAEMRFLQPSEPIVAKGPFYVAFEFDNSFVLDEADTHLSRSIFGIGGFEHRSKQTTFYVLPESLPETATCATGSYVPVDQIAPEYKGLGLNLVAWMNVEKEGTAASVAMTADGTVAFAAKLDGETLTVSGTKAGETVRVLNAAGQLVAKTTANDLSTALSLAGQPSGVYLVSTSMGTKKVMKR